jgi:hypothetical protein
MQIVRSTQFSAWPFLERVAVGPRKSCIPRTSCDSQMGNASFPVLRVSRLGGTGHSPASVPRSLEVEPHSPIATWVGRQWNRIPCSTRFVPVRESSAETGNDGFPGGFVPRQEGNAAFPRNHAARQEGMRLTNPKYGAKTRECGIPRAVLHPLPSGSEGGRERMGGVVRDRRRGDPFDLREPRDRNRSLPRNSAASTNRASTCLPREASAPPCGLGTRPCPSSTSPNQGHAPARRKERDFVAYEKKLNAPQSLAGENLSFRQLFRR